MSDLPPDRELWMHNANCVGTDPEAFFPQPGTPGTDAKRICFRCDVRSDCLTWAFDHPETGGVLGGWNDNERRRQRRGEVVKVYVPKERPASPPRCEFCNCLYAPATGGQKYCSRRCSAAAANARRRAS